MPMLWKIAYLWNIYYVSLTIILSPISLSTAEYGSFRITNLNPFEKITPTTFLSAQKILAHFFPLAILQWNLTKILWGRKKYSFVCPFRDQPRVSKKAYPYHWILTYLRRLNTMLISKFDFQIMFLCWLTNLSAHLISLNLQNSIMF